MLFGTKISYRIQIVLSQFVLLHDVIEMCYFRPVYHCSIAIIWCDSIVCVH